MKMVHDHINSPDSKKIRLNKEADSKSTREMEVQVNEKDFESNDVSDDKVESMDVDDREESNNLSKLRDEKILQKQKLIEEEEELIKKATSASGG